MIFLICLDQLTLTRTYDAFLPSSRNLFNAARIESPDPATLTFPHVDMTLGRCFSMTEAGLLITAVK